jgi:peptidoglycan/LPS O-acetylase OafA/YrhL
MKSTHHPPAYFCTLDAVRGFAALVVVLYHWQFFYYANDTWVQDAFERTALPLYPYLSAIYNDGEIVVDLFFLLSGFIFFWLYAERIATRKVDFRKFIVFRLTRLYPTHLVTLVLVAVLQWLMFKNTGHYYIVLYNDTYHFILNLFFMQNWGFEKGPSFNGPAWSVSVEVFLYLVFFTICYLKLEKKKWLLFLFIPLGVFLQYYYTLIGKGMYTFFLGGLLYYVYIWILKENRIKKYLPVLTILTIAIIVLIIAEYQLSYFRDIFFKQYFHLLPGKSLKSAESAFALGRNFFFRTFVSPITVITLALWETSKGTLNKKWAVLGNCGYAIYLIHFALQIIFVLIVDAFHINRHVFRSPFTLLVFFLILLPLSLVTYYYFELPIQEKLRKKFSKAKGSNTGKTNNDDINVAGAKAKT